MRTSLIRSRGVSAALIVFSNFVPLYGVIADGWPVSYVVMVFCFDVLMLVVFAALRILFAPPPPELPPTATTRAFIYKTVVAAVTLTVQGGLVLVYGFFLALLFGGDVTSGGIVASPDVPKELVASMLSEPNVRWSALAIVVNHAYSFASTYIAGGEWRTARAATLFAEPMRHVIVLHVGIVLGGLALVLLAPPVVGGAVLLGVKTISDLRALARERKPARVRAR